MSTESIRNPTSALHEHYERAAVEMLSAVSNSIRTKTTASARVTSTSAALVSIPALPGFTEYTACKTMDGDLYLDVQGTNWRIHVAKRETAPDAVEPVATKHMIDLQPNITVDQAKRMEDALNQRHAAGEELVRQFRDLLRSGLQSHLQKHRLNQEAEDTLDEMTHALKEWDEHNKVFTDAVFERKPKQVLVPGKGGEWPGTVHTIKTQDIPIPSHLREGPEHTA